MAEQLGFIKIMKELGKPKIEKGPEREFVPEKLREEEKIEKIEEKWKKEEERSEEERKRELEKAREKIAEKIAKIGEEKAKKEKEKELGREKKEIFERVKEVICIPSEELIIYYDLISNDSEEAWRTREELLKAGRKWVIATVARIKSERAREFLRKNLGKKEKQKNWRKISAGLMFNDTEWADKIRECLRFDKEAGRIRAGRNAKVLKALGLNKSERWFEFRKVLDKFSSSLFSLFRMDRVLPAGLYVPGDLLLSEIGVPAENETKKRLLKELGDDSPAEAILSCLGDSSDEARETVEKYYGGDKELEWARQRWQKSLEKE
jgi:hypothetical protein